MAGAVVLAAASDGDGGCSWLYSYRVFWFALDALPTGDGAVEHVCSISESVLGKFLPRGMYRITRGSK